MASTIMRRSSVASTSSEGPSTVEVLRKQEMSRCYQCEDYLSDNKQPSAKAKAAEGVVTEAVRAEMLEWVCKVSAFLKLNEDVAVITATLLDRFMQTTEGSTILSSISDFRLATMACFYLTTKVHALEQHDQLCPYTVSSKAMSLFSHGLFSARQVEDMELRILQAMEWRANPPTALMFVREFLFLLPCSVPISMKDQAYQLCQTQIRRSLLDYKVFALTEASTIAFFAVQNALRTLGMDEILLKHIASIFSYATHTDYSDQPSGTEERIHAALMAGADKQQRSASPFAPLHHILKPKPSNKRQRRRSSSSSVSSTSSSTTSSHRRWHNQQQHHRWSNRRIDVYGQSPCGVAV